MNRIASLYRYFLSYARDMTHVERIVAVRHFVVVSLHITVVLLLCQIAKTLNTMHHDLIPSTDLFGRIRVTGTVQVENAVEVKNADDTSLLVEVSGVRQSR